MSCLVSSLRYWTRCPRALMVMCVAYRTGSSASRGRSADALLASEIALNPVNLARISGVAVNTTCRSWLRASMRESTAERRAIKPSHRPNDDLSPVRVHAHIDISERERSSDRPQQIGTSSAGSGRAAVGDTSSNRSAEILEKIRRQPPPSSVTRLDSLVSDRCRPGLFAISQVDLPTDVNILDVVSDLDTSSASGSRWHLIRAWSAQPALDPGLSRRSTAVNVSR